ncbi:hypothetical protein KP591P3_00030 [Klebsiella phage KP591P3]|uniref:hypothetical protein n=1 Tax=Klebsiella phage KP591P1 TaxID=2968665 RepID=UPI00233EF0FD|nr:hypothetical protein PRB84_gp67 [Klebsiella phage KP591P1]YP_010685446.1 hypothetical protein PRB85_gp30 [Klebsiella phage KP591P3]WAX16348.1 hypothetical protein KP591P1_00067 [Klebsiella phage KP591P1]WAX16389.1 hypothetical protein KP591P3_00030 [Klebsiella phage KP591P3]
MNKFKGTPGPWEIKPEEVDRPYIRIRGTRLGGRFKVANVLSPDYDGVHHREADETRANARLIAAAPELLEALTTTLDEIGHWLSQQKPDLKKKIDSAITKALGESK